MEGHRPLDTWWEAETGTWLISHNSNGVQGPADGFVKGWTTNVSVFVTLCLPQSPSLAIQGAVVDDGIEVW